MYESNEPNNEIVIPKIEIPVVVQATDIPDDEQAVADILAAARKQLAEMSEMMKPLQEMQKGFLKESEHFAKQAREAERKAKQVESSMWDAQRAVRKIEETVNNAERKANRIAATKKFKESLTVLQEEFNLITAGAPWREWAKDHQIKGMHHLAMAKRCLLADAPRFGKTMTVLGACDMLQAKRILVLTPNTVTAEFFKQIQRWAPHRGIVMNLAGKSKAQRKSDLSVLQLMPDCVVVVNYESWRKDFDFIDRLIDMKFDTVIIDEAHNINNTKTSAFRGIEKIVFAENDADTPKSCTHCNEPVTYDEDPEFSWGAKGWLDSNGETACILNEVYPNKHQASTCSVVNVFPMTGTVIVNKPQDLFALLNLIDRRAFPDMYAYERDFLMKDWESGKWVFKSGGLDRLTKKLADKYIRRDRDNSPEIDIPTPEIVVRNIELDPATHPAQYKVIRDLNQAIIDLVDQDNKKIGIDYAITLILRKRQAITWPHFTLKDDEGTEMIKFEVDESCKMDEVIRFENSDRNEWAGMIPDLVGSGEKVVFFSQFTGPLDEASRRLTAAGIKHVRIDGSVDRETRQSAQVAFNEVSIADGGPAVILGNFRAMGTGINLAGANEMIIFDEEWNPAKNDQAYDRIVEMGKQEKCQVTILRVENSIDVWMARLNEQKRDMVDGFNNKMDLAAEFLAEIKSGLL